MPTNAATTVAIGPIKRAEFKYKTLLVSKNRPGDIVQGVIINKMATKPIIKPATMPYLTDLTSDLLLQKMSYSKVAASKMAPFCSNPTNISRFIVKYNRCLSLQI